MLTETSARAAPTETFRGYLSVLVVDMNLVTLYKRNMLLCSEW